jgi:hypothetical protein
VNPDFFSVSTQLLESYKDDFDDCADDLYILPQDVYDKLVDIFQNYPEEQKELTKKAVRTAFSLNSRDMVFFRDSKLFVKKVNFGLLENDSLPIKKPVVSDSQASQNVQNNCIVLSALEILESSEYAGQPLNTEIKEFIKAKLKQEISLGEKDIIVFMGDKVVVRRFVESNGEKKAESRYNGLPKEELEIIRSKNFPDVESEFAMMKTIMEQAMREELNFSVISFLYYEKNYIKVIQKYMMTFLAENMYEDENVLLGLVNLILRTHWNFVHKLMAEKILDLLSNKDSNAERFIKSYSGDVAFGADNVKYRLPEIIDENDKKWNAVSIFSLILQYKKGQDSIEQKKKSSIAYAEKIKQFEEDIQKMEEESDYIQGTVGAIESELTGYFDNEKLLNEELKYLRSEQKEASTESQKNKYQNDISIKMLALKKVSFKQEDAMSRKKTIENQLKLLTSKIEKLKMDIVQNKKKEKDELEKLQSYVSTLGEINSRFLVVINAVAMALMKKKTILS